MASGKDVVKLATQIAASKRLVITVSWCKSCGICMEICPKAALGTQEVTRKVVLIAPDRCNGCGFCELVCPDYVFAIEDTENTPG